MLCGRRGGGSSGRCDVTARVPQLAHADRSCGSIGAVLHDISQFQHPLLLRQRAVAKGPSHVRPWARVVRRSPPLAEGPPERSLGRSGRTVGKRRRESSRTDQMSPRRTSPPIPDFVRLRVRRRTLHSPNHACCSRASDALRARQGCAVAPAIRLGRSTRTSAGRRPASYPSFA